MGMDAKAYLFYGTKPVDELPEHLLPEDDDRDPCEVAEELAPMCASLGVELVWPSNDYPWYSLAVAGSVTFHDWDYGPTEVNPDSLGVAPNTEALNRAVTELKWPGGQSYAWWLMADYS